MVIDIPISFQALTIPRCFYPGFPPLVDGEPYLQHVAGFTPCFPRLPSSARTLTRHIDESALGCRTQQERHLELNSLHLAFLALSETVCSAMPIYCAKVGCPGHTASTAMLFLKKFSSSLPRIVAQSGYSTEFFRKFLAFMPCRTLLWKWQVKRQKLRNIVPM